MSSSVTSLQTVTDLFPMHAFRPMYIDSTNDSPKSGDLPVSELLRATVEPLLKVSPL